MKLRLFTPMLAIVGGLALMSCLSNAPAPPAAADLAIPPATTVDMAQASITILPNLSARQLFEQFVKPSLTRCNEKSSNPECNSGRSGVCGECHYASHDTTPGFLASSLPDSYDPYDTVIGYKANQFINAAPDQSDLITKGAHAGPALSMSQHDIVLQWLQKEQQERTIATPKTANPQVPPFQILLSTPTSKQLNKVYLDQISAKFTGAYLSFYATALANNAGLELSSIRIVNTKLTVVANEQRSIHMSHPLFVLWIDGNPLPDPVDSFSTTDTTVTLNQDVGTADMGSNTGTLIVPGLLTLGQYHSGAALSVAFSTLEVVGPLVPPNPCKAAGLTIFTNMLAKNYLGKPFGCAQDGRCHNNVSQAAGINMTAAKDPKADLTSLCETLKFYNGLGVIMQNLDPVNQNGHPFKWSSANCMAGGNNLPGTCYTDFVNVLNAWGAAEK